MTWCVLLSKEMNLFPGLGQCRYPHVSGQTGRPIVSVESNHIGVYLGDVLSFFL